MRCSLLIYDGNDGQIQSGLGPWEKFPEWKQKALLDEDPEAKSKIMTLHQIFRDIEINLVEVSSYKECVEMIQTTHVLVVCKGIVDHHLLEKAVNLKEIHVLGNNVDKIDTKEIHKRGINFITHPMTNFLAVAEHTVTLMLAATKKLPKSDRIVREASSWMVVPGGIPLLRNLTIGLLGVGEIGYEVIRLLKPWGCRIIYYDIDRKNYLEKELGPHYVSWVELFKESDILSLHLPLNEDTISVVSNDSISLMKPNSIIINTARGELINEDALMAAMVSNRIHGAGLDVFATEPLPADHPFTKMENVILTPHCAWASPWTLVNDAQSLLSKVASSIQTNYYSRMTE